MENNYNLVASEGRLTDRLVVSELDFQDRIEFNIKEDRHNGIIFAILYGAKKRITSFKIESGTPLEYGTNTVRFSYLPLQLDNRLSGALIYIYRETGECILAQVLKYDVKGGTPLFYSPGGKSETEFRKKLNEKMDPKRALAFSEEKLPGKDIQNQIILETDWLNAGRNDSRYLPQKIIQAYRFLLSIVGESRDRITDVAEYLFRRIGIPCITIKGYSSYLGKGGRDIEQGHSYPINSKWNMIWVNDKWNYLDAIQDTIIGRGEGAAVNSFMSSPEWFGTMHISAGIDDGL